MFRLRVASGSEPDDSRQTADILDLGIAIKWRRRLVAPRYEYFILDTIGAISYTGGGLGDIVVGVDELGNPVYLLLLLLYHSGECTLLHIFFDLIFYP